VEPVTRDRRQDTGWRACGLPRQAHVLRRSRSPCRRPGFRHHQDRVSE
jgi:hypothetical protein